MRLRWQRRRKKRRMTEWAVRKTMMTRMGVMERKVASRRSALCLVIKLRWSPCLRPCASVRRFIPIPKTTTRTTTLKAKSTTSRRPKPVRPITSSRQSRLIYLDREAWHQPTAAGLSRSKWVGRPSPSTPLKHWILTSEHGHADIPTFYTCDEGLSSLTQEGQATLERLEGMLAQSVAQRYHMGGVRTQQGDGQCDDGMEVDAEAEAGQFEDADVEH
ncbi:methylosome subunit pICln isoform X1 [Stigmatopora nigra]